MTRSARQFASSPYPLFEHGTAHLSPCGLYRYHLSRFTGINGSPRRAVWVMLNPSKADAAIDDPTTCALREFTIRFRCTSFDIMNLYAWRATDPKELWRAPDPVGPDNDRWIAETCHGADVIVCAWGSFGEKVRIASVLAQIPRPRYALGVNKDGNPKHPLYVRRDTPLREYL